MINIKTLDLNLLVTLDILLEELNVTRAAEKLNLSQPSVSIQLSKLRQIFNDPLLLSSPRGMVATARAEELRGPLKDALKALHCAVSSAPAFDPATTQKTWHIAATDYTETTIILPLVKELRQQAHNSRLAIHALRPNKLGQLSERPDIDLAFHTCHEAPPGMRQKLLYTESYVLVTHDRHEKGKAPTNLDVFCSLEHIVVSPDNGGFYGPTDEALKQLDRKRNVVLSVPHFHIALQIVQNSDVVAVLPKRLVKNQPGIRLYQPPITIPGFDISMLWHERLYRDPAHIWLRNFIFSNLRKDGI